MNKLLKLPLFILLFLALTACGTITGNYINYDDKSNVINYIQLIDNKDNLTGTIKEFKVDSNNNSQIITTTNPISGQRNGSNFSIKIGGILINETVSGIIKNGNLIISDFNTPNVYTFTRSNQTQLNNDLKNLTSK